METHADIDLGVVRSDAPRLPEVLVDWELFVAAAGVLRPWDRAPLSVDRHENNVWARRRGADHWSIDITVSDGTENDWVYRRDARVRLPWSEAVLGAAGGLPYLAPEAQLLFKSRHPRRPKDDHDAAVVLPRLGDPHSTRLRAWLAPDHPWRGILAEP